MIILYIFISTLSVIKGKDEIFWTEWNQALTEFIAIVISFLMKFCLGAKVGYLVLWLGYGLTTEDS